jgi:hypothetical protein
LIRFLNHKLLKNLIKIPEIDWDIKIQIKYLELLKTFLEDEKLDLALKAKKYLKI